jgi:plasmid stabilization system protein ParE
MSTQPKRTPLGEQLMNDPGVSAWFRSVQPFVDKLAGIPDGLQQLLQAHFEKRLEIEVNGNLSKQGQNEQRAELARVMLQSIDTIQADAERAVQALESKIDAALQPAQLGTQDALLREMQITRAWMRLKSQLDTLTDAGQMARKFEQIAGDAARLPGADGKPVLAALREELPSYLEARQMRGLAQELINRLNQVEAPFLPPIGRAALQLNMVCEGGWARLMGAFQMARTAAQGGGNPSVLPGFYIPERMRF